ncbi:flagellar motor protein MotB [Gilliamella sp. Pas-s95]|uniref:flagellar motor protein MotB n=1 Tax=Gilliamella sp. Pas-s95 TaxID=2687317 RepID=UPI0013207ED1|nr:flagellar motor protein MotB [Gilliamella sp. Pas-s95]MWN06693.1 flagellar motor protein MotB [Gilliamella sp. Pas-s95]
MKDKSVRIIIKKKSGHGGGHHGGSWKIAYADFMTAMMALFLVMWLISTSTPQELKGIAEYFRTPLILGQNGGKNISDSESPIPGGGDDVSQQIGEEKNSVSNSLHNELEKQQLEKIQLIETAKKIFEMFEIDPRLKKLAPNLIVELTQMGLRIQILASDDKPMFDVGSTAIDPNMQEILHALAPILNSLPNKITLSGHTDERQYTTGDRGYSNWELSADRANASRRELIVGGLDSNKIIRIIALADTVSLNNPNYSKDANRRISILILNKTAQQYIEEENNMTGIDFLRQSQQLKPE